MTGLYTFFKDGGIWMYPIMIAQIVSFALIAERLMALYITRSKNARTIVAGMEEDIKRGELTRVLSKADAYPMHPVGLAAKVGVQSVMNMSGREEIQLKMEELVMEEASRVDKRIGLLAMIANVATLLGLLGTVVGLIRSFTSISIADAAQKASLLSAGISEAMSATAYGLVVAVPALIAYAILQSRANELTDDLNKAILRLYIFFGFNIEPQVSAKISKKSL